MEDLSKIYVPPLVKDGREIVPAAVMDWEIRFLTGENLEHSALEYNLEMRLPTLAQLRHAFFDSTEGEQVTWRKIADGRKYEREAWPSIEKGIYERRGYDIYMSSGIWAAPEYRESVFHFNETNKPKPRGEWTSTFRQPRRRKRGEMMPEDYVPIILVNTGGILHISKKGMLDIDAYPNEDVFETTEPPYGYVKRYDIRTGYPLETGTYEEAKQIFGYETSLFYPARLDRLTAISRLSNGEPFEVNVNLLPHRFQLFRGGRSCSTSSPSQACREAPCLTSSPEKRISQQKEAKPHFQS